MAIALGLYRGVSRSGRSTTGLILLGLNGVALLVVAIFPADLRGAPPTITGLLLVLASFVAFTSLVAALLLLARRFKQDEYWRAFYPMAFGLALVALVLFFASLATSTSGFAGLTQRLLIASLLAWLLLTGARLRAAAGQFAYSG